MLILVAMPEGWDYRGSSKGVIDDYVRIIADGECAIRRMDNLISRADFRLRPGSMIFYFATIPPWLPVGMSPEDKLTDHSAGPS